MSNLHERYLKAKAAAEPDPGPREQAVVQLPPQGPPQGPPLYYTDISSWDDFHDVVADLVDSLSRVSSWYLRLEAKKHNAEKLRRAKAPSWSVAYDCYESSRADFLTDLGHVMAKASMIHTFIENPGFLDVAAAVVAEERGGRAS